MSKYVISQLSSSSVPADGSITSAKIADGTIVNVDIADATIAGSKLVNNTITATQIANLTIGAGQIADGAITSAKIFNNTVVNEDISTTAAIAPAKIAGTAVITTDPRLSDARTPTAHLHDDRYPVTVKASGGTYPARPANATQVIWVGANDPGALSIDGDMWVQI